MVARQTICTRPLALPTVFPFCIPPWLAVLLRFFISMYTGLSQCANRSSHVLCCYMTEHGGCARRMQSRMQTLPASKWWRLWRPRTGRTSTAWRGRPSTVACWRPLRMTERHACGACDCNPYCHTEYIGIDQTLRQPGGEDRELALLCTLLVTIMALKVVRDAMPRKSKRARRLSRSRPPSCQPHTPWRPLLAVS